MEVTVLALSKTLPRWALLEANRRVREELNLIPAYNRDIRDGIANGLIREYGNEGGFRGRPVTALLAEPRHVDDFIDDPTSDKYASSWFEAFRRPALDKMRKPDSRRLFATYEGKRYRVTGCSRMGDVWLHSNFNEEWTYEHRVPVDACSGWASEHAPTGRVGEESGR